LVEGRVNPDPETGGPRVYQRQDGSHGAQFEVTALRVQFLGGGNGNGRAAGAGAELDEPPADLDLDADSIPF
jgi:single-strand DNA-binding protein